MGVTAAIGLGGALLGAAAGGAFSKPKQKTPTPPAPPPAPESPDAEQTAERERQAAAAEKKRAQGGRGRGDTILTGGQGVLAPSAIDYKTLLGY